MLQKKKKKGGAARTKASSSATASQPSSSSTHLPIRQKAVSPCSPDRGGDDSPLNLQSSHDEEPILTSGHRASTSQCRGCTKTVSDGASKTTAATPASHVPEDTELSANKEPADTDTVASMNFEGSEQSSAKAIAAEADASVAHMFRNIPDLIPPRLPADATHPILNFRKFLPRVVEHKLQKYFDLEDVEHTFERIEHFGYPSMTGDAPMTLAIRRRYARLEGQLDVLRIERFLTELTEKMRVMVAMKLVILVNIRGRRATEERPADECDRFFHEVIDVFEAYREAFKWPQVVDL